MSVEPTAAAAAAEEEEDLSHVLETTATAAAEAALEAQGASLHIDIGAREVSPVPDDDDEEMDEDDEDYAGGSSAAASSSSKAAKKVPGSPKKGSAEEKKLARKIEKEERKAARKHKEEQKERLKKVREDQNASMSTSGENAAAARLRFLEQQAEVFSRFTDAGVGASAAGKSKKGKGRSGKAGRMTEDQEDSIMMKANAHATRATRLTVQPASVNQWPDGKEGEAKAKHCPMRSYQLEGLNWLTSLYDQGINGILADEMGLGKTLQTISLLAHLKFDRKVSGPHLIILPKSVLGNWQREFRRWCPGMKVIKVHGTKAERAAQIKDTMLAGDFDVVCTTYEVTIIEKSAFLKFRWRYIIIDEAHRIKNENSMLSKVVRMLNSQCRLLITGTPLQNNLHELWALLNFLLPEVFSDASMFDDFFAADTMKEDTVVSKLHAILRPFMIRRLKKDVEKDLPAKREIKLFTGLTEMQTYWYKKLLSKDVGALNQLGGPEKTRLLNVLMQLRKVCNHPYLFQGAEPGPPYFDGPHLWENAGKMLLLDKLLTKLKKNGDRVLLFSQMTRLLDVIEDYVRYKRYKYCRIDGSTSNADRDRQMEEFNAPDAEQFIFLLSTRAGGLGINLATANIVILYDSDWNPQMDLQAQDRAHRIGQKKEVIVFRLVTEGTVEEKIVERAERKLYLDAVVVQQGRLQEQNKGLSKGELMTMVKFGADTIFKSKGTITDDDIDAILQRGEAKTAEGVKALDKIKENAQLNLMDFRLDEETADTFDFMGENYRKKKGESFIQLPARERKKNYNENSYYREQVASVQGADGMKKFKEPRLPKGMVMHDFQFFQKAEIEALETKENSFFLQKRTQLQLIKEVKHRERKEQAAAEADAERHHGQPAYNTDLESERLEKVLEELELSAEEAARKEALVEEGFGSWNRRDFRAYSAACEHHGRNAKEYIVHEVSESTGKPKPEVRQYHKVFWERYKELADWEKIIDRIEKGELKIARRESIAKALNRKIARTKNPWQTLNLNYGANKGKAFTDDEDRFLVCMMQQLGYGQWDALKLEIRQAWQFRFDWFLKSRTPSELQRRCDTLVRLIEKENEEYEMEERVRKKESGKRKANGNGGPASKKKKA